MKHSLTEHSILSFRYSRLVIVATLSPLYRVMAVSECWERWN